MNRINVQSRSKEELIDITRDIQKLVADSGVANGVCYIFVPHTTAAVTLNENADPSVSSDIVARLDSLVPRNVSYGHTEGNAPAHIKAAVIGASATVFIEDGILVLGTWQGMFLCEFDGPRRRNVIIKIVPDAIQPSPEL
jgi:secondary thiamine-phosphate synthase enzyme